MDCSVCTTMPSILRPPRNTICGSCYEGARTTIALLKKLEGANEDQDHDKSTDKSTVNNGSSLSSSPLFSREVRTLHIVILTYVFKKLSKFIYIKIHQFVRFICYIPAATITKGDQMDKKHERNRRGTEEENSLLEQLCFGIQRTTSY